MCSLPQRSLESSHFWYLHCTFFALSIKVLSMLCKANTILNLPENNRFALSCLSMFDVSLKFTAKVPYFFWQFPQNAPVLFNLWIWTSSCWILLITHYTPKKQELFHWRNCPPQDRPMLTFKSHWNEVYILLQ